MMGLWRGDNASAPTCAQLHRCRWGTISERRASVLIETTGTPSAVITYLSGNREGYGNECSGSRLPVWHPPTGVLSFPVLSPLIHWPTGACLFPEVTQWALAFPDKVGGRKGHAWKPLLYFVICFFPHGEQISFSYLERGAQPFFINLTDPSASLWLLMVSAGLALRVGASSPPLIAFPREKSLLFLQTIFYYSDLNTLISCPFAIWQNIVCVFFEWKWNLSWNTS